MLIPAQNMEIEAIYADLTAAHYRSVVVTAANAGEGVSTVASALAQRHLLAGNSTLVVDLNLYHPSLNPLLSLTETLNPQALLSPPQLVSEDHSMSPLVGVVAPKDRAAIMKLRKPGVLENYLQHWHEQYHMVIIDACPLNRVNSGNIPAERIAAACDTSILVVLAGHTREAMVTKAVDRLKHAEANLLGCVLNDRDNPSLKQELIRESQRLGKRLPSIAKLLKNWVAQNQFLSLDG